ncbi:hypothetical protein [Nocardia sp. NPDC052112]|uniref:hypothetical protein n=1 Tax=Nocardia sp. NPDC052112 TaxID=3155646 RepID=UPI00343BA0AD
MTVTHKRFHRPGGVDRGTALLASVTCLIFVAGIATITRSFATTAASAGCIAAGLVVTIGILPHSR